MISSTVANGNYRMRIRAVYDYNQNKPMPSCGPIEYGSTVDFTVNVSAAATCVAPNVLTG